MAKSEAPKKRTCTPCIGTGKIQFKRVPGKSFEYKTCTACEGTGKVDR